MSRGLDPLTCYHRKHWIRVLLGEFTPATGVRLCNRVYDDATSAAQPPVMRRWPNAGLNRIPAASGQQFGT